MQRHRRMNVCFSGYAWGKSMFFLLIVFMIFSCRKFDGDMVFTIYEGQYRSHPRIMQATGNIIDFEFYTHPSWQFDKDYTIGWSKLVGIGHLDHHQNSARIGWKTDGDSIRICGYFYRNGERHMLEFHKLALRKWYRGSVVFFNGTYTITVGNESISLSGYDKGHHYVKNPYFGGRKPAPQNITFHFRNAYSMHAW